MNKQSIVELTQPTGQYQIKATVVGDKDIMFDRYAGDNKTVLEPWQKLYLDPLDSRSIVFPAVNIISALTAQNTDSYPKSILDQRKYKKSCHAFAQSLSINDPYIRFKNDDGYVELGNIVDGVDALSGVYIHRTVARLPQGIPNPKERPVLPTPWSLEWVFDVRPSGDFVEQQLQNVLAEGLRTIGLGTYRRTFGRAELVGWEILNE